MAQKFPTVSAYLKQLEPRIRQGAIDAARRTARERAAKLNDVVRGWKNKVVFRVQEKQERGVTKFQIVAEGTDEALAIFGYVDKGTPAHRIEPKTADGTLAFWTRFEARTAPVAVANAGSGRSWGEIVWTRGVDHPGTEARDFIAYALLEDEEAYEQRLEELLSRVARE